MKIRNKITLTFIALFTVAIVIIGFAIQTISTRIITNQVTQDLEANAYLTAEYINKTLEEQKDKIVIAATHSDLSTEELKEIRDLQAEFYDLSVLDSNGQVIVSSEEYQLGLNQSNDDYFIHGKEAVYIKDAYLSDTTQEESIAVSTPFNGGVLVARIKISILNDILSKTSGQTETGEVYLVNNEKYMITPSRFIEGTFLKQEVITPSTEHCFENDLPTAHNEASVFKDYIGNYVLGTHVYLEEMDWCLLVEINRKEVLAPIWIILRNYLLLSGIVLLLYVLISWLLSHTISKPIEILRHGVEIIEKGNLDHRIGIKSKDEIGDLSRSFDKMTRAIKKSRAGVDKQVKEQTKEMSMHAEDLRKQQLAILNILEDIGEERDRVTEEKSKTEAILYSIGDGVFVVDKNGFIILFNKSAADLTGYGIDDAIGKHFSKIIRLYDETLKQRKDKFINEVLSTGESRNMSDNTFLLRKDKSSMAVADSASALKDKDGNVIGCVVVFRDETKEREIDKAKTEFVSLASHQLRTPLSAINWYTEMLLNGDAGKLNNDQRQYLEEVYSGNQRMVALVNALLNVSRLELGTFVIEPEEVNVVGLLSDILKELTPTIKEKKQIVNKSVGKIDKYFADPRLMTMVFQNLLSNSVKYTPEKGKISIELNQNKEFIRFKVVDSGIGIAASEKDQVFSKLFRGANAKEGDTEGTGLGLYIIKSIMDNIGGKITFESKLNKGTTFIVDFPIKGMIEKEGTKRLTQKI
jgi:PAS domain S-box-containing protein